VDANQCKMARVALGVGVRQLGDAAMVSPSTVSRLEAGEELKPRTVLAIRGVLEAMGAIFINEEGEDGEVSGVLIRKPRRRMHHEGQSDD